MNIFDPKVSGSLSVSGSGNISGDLTVLGTIYATISGTTQNAVSASHAAAYTLTSSFHQFTSSFNTGSFTGSFSGDGTGLYGIPATGVTGLNLSRISDGSATASISQANGLIINTNTEITGNLTVTGRLTAQEYHTELVSASIIYESGSSKFGDTLDDTHQITGSVDISGSLKANNVALATDRLINISVSDAGGKYFIDNVRNPILTLIKGYTYKFLFPNIGAHPFRFSTTNDGTHNGGSIYSTGVTTGSTPDYIEIQVTNSTPSTLYYFCTAHTGMGNSISVLGDILNNEADRAVVYIEPARIATTGSNAFTGSQIVSGSLSVTGSVEITGSISLNGQPIGTGKLDETVFNAYTSSNDGRVSALEISTGSLNSFTSSIDSTIKTKMNNDGVVSGSVQINITGTTGYSAFSSSIATTDLNQENRLGSIETSTGSLNTFSSSAGSRLSSLETSSGSIRNDFNSYTSSNDSTNSTQNSRLTSLENSTSSLNTFTSSASSRLSLIETSTGSLNAFTSSADSRLTSLESASSSIRSDFNSYTSSNDSTNTTQNNRLNSLESTSGSVNNFTSSAASSLSSLESASGSIRNDFNSYTSSNNSTNTNQNNRLTAIETATSSLNSFTSSIDSTIKTKLNTEGVISGSAQVNITSTTGYSTFSSSIATTDLNQENRLTSLEGKTGSYATTGSNIYQGNQTITGSLYISQDLIVAGSSSIQHISSSIVNIADNIITVNAQNPSVRFGGLAVIDSGSSPQVSGSMLFDSVNNQWIFVHQNQSTITSSVLLMGPETYNNLGGEGYLTQNRIPKGSGIEHLNDSNITDTGTKVSINSNTEVTGTLVVTGNVSSPNISAIQTATGSLNSFTSSLLTAIELTGSNLTVKGNLLVKGTTTNVNTTTLDVDNNLINLNGTGASFAGLRVKDTTAPNQISGSFLWDATNDYWIAGQLGSEQRIVRETEFSNAVTRIGNIETSTGSLNSFTSSINTTIKTKLNNDGVISGSSQVNHNATTNYDANQHIDHTTVSITAGSGLSGGGTIAATRTLSIATGGVTNAMLANSAITIAGTSTSLGGSISAATILSGTGVVSGSAQLTSTFVQKSGDTMTGDLRFNQGSGYGRISYVDNYHGFVLRGIPNNAAGDITAGDQTSLIQHSGDFRFYRTNGTINELYFQVNATAAYHRGNQIWDVSDFTSTDVTNWGTAYTYSQVGHLPLAGGTLTGRLTIGSTGTAGSATLKINTSTASSFIHSQENFSPNMTAGQTNIFVIGSSGSTKNSGYIGYNWAGAGSNSNYVSIGHWGADHLFRVYGDGTVYMGTVTTGVWNGSSISTTYTDAKVTSISGTSNQITASASTGAITLSLPQNIHTSATPTFAGLTATFLRSGTATSNLVKYGSGASSVTFGNSLGANATDTSRTVFFRGASSTASVWWGGPDANGDNIPHGAIDSLSTGGLTHWYNSAGTGGGTWTKIMTVDNSGVTVNSGNFIGSLSGNATNITASSNTSLTSLSNLATVGTITSGTWQGSSISTTYTAAKVTAVNAGTGVSVDTTTGSVTVSIGQAVATSSTPTFGGLTVGNGVSTGRSSYGITSANIILTSSTSDATGYCGIDFRSGNNYPSDGAQIYYENNSGGASERAKLTIRVENDQEDFMEIRAGRIDINSNTVSGGGQATLVNFQSAGSTVAYVTSGGAIYARSGNLVKDFGNSTYTTSFTNVSSVTVTHSLGSKDVMVMCYDNNDEMFWPSSIVTTSTSVVTITFAANRTGRVVVLR